MIKLVNLDLDGTLLTDTSEVTDYTKGVLKKAVDKKVNIVLATGRPKGFTLSIANENNISKYIIFGNGSAVYDVKNDKNIYESFLKLEKLKEIIELCEQNSIFYYVHTDQLVITKNIKYNLLYYYKTNQNKPYEKRTKIRIVSDILEYIKRENIKDVSKVTICESNEKIFLNILEKIKEIENVDLTFTDSISTKKIIEKQREYNIDYKYLEISNTGSNKWDAIKALAEKLGISEKEIMSIGDNQNDYEMIKKSGIGVAMKNSMDNVLEIADYITDDNNNNGVAKAIEKFVLDIK